MNESKEGLYNINDAKALSLYLSGSKKLTDVESTSPYLQFTLGTQVKPKAVQTPGTDAESAEAKAPAIPGKPFDSWEEMIAWCFDITKSHSCFVVDPQGFILMREGKEFPEDGFEGAGANLQLAVDQLRLMELDENEINVLDLKYPDKTVFIVRAQDKDNDYFTLCFIGDTAVSDVQKKILFQQIQRSVIRMT